MFRARRQPRSNRTRSPPACVTGLGRAQMRQHGEDAAVAVLALGHAELQEQVAHVRLDRALAEVEALGDAGVRESLRHQLEHLALALGQLGERAVGARPRDEARDDLGVERRAALGDALRRGQELTDVEHAVLQEVAEAAERDELDGVRRLDVLREHEDAELRVRLLHVPRGEGALVGERRRHADVEHDEVGMLVVDRAQAARPRCRARRRPRARRPRTGGRAPRAGAPGPRRSGRARQLRGQGRAGAVGALDPERAAQRGHAVGEAVEPGARAGRRAADAVVGDAR